MSLPGMARSLLGATTVLTGVRNERVAVDIPNLSLDRPFQPLSSEAVAEFLPDDLFSSSIFMQTHKSIMHLVVNDTAALHSAFGDNSTSNESTSARHLSATEGSHANEHREAGITEGIVSLLHFPFKLTEGSKNNDTSSGVAIDKNVSIAASALEVVAKHIPRDLHMSSNYSAKLLELLKEKANASAGLIAGLYNATSLSNASSFWGMVHDTVNSSEEVMNRLRTAHLPAEVMQKLHAVHMPAELLQLPNASKVWAMVEANASQAWDVVQNHIHDPSVNMDYLMNEQKNTLGNNRSHVWGVAPAHAFPHIHVVQARTDTFYHGPNNPSYGMSVPELHYGGSGTGVVGRYGRSIVQHSDLPDDFSINNFWANDFRTRLLPSTMLLAFASLLAPLLFVGLCLARLWVQTASKKKTVPLKPQLMPEVTSPFYSRAKQVSVVPADDTLLSVWDGTVATFSSIVGTGLLAMPYAFSMAGLIGGTVAILIFVACSAYTAHLMAWTLNEKTSVGRYGNVRSELQGWPLLVEAAFGYKAKCAIIIFLIVELWGYLLSTIITSAMNLNQVSELISLPSAITITVFAAYALNFAPPKLLTNLNVFANACYIICCLMFLATGLFLPTRAPTSDINLVRPHGFISAAGILVFSPAAHSFYPTIMQRMEQPGKYPVCVRRAYIGACGLYLTIAAFGYYLFGNAIQPSIVKNIGVDLQLMPIPGLGWMNSAAAVFMVFKMLAMQPLILQPLNSTVEGWLEDSGSFVQNAASAGPALSVGVLLLSAVVSMRFAHQVAVVLNFVGSVFCMTIAFVVPVLCYWKLQGESLSFMKKIVFCSLVSMGGFFATIGMTAIFN